MPGTRYDSIGTDYASTRREDQSVSLEASREPAGVHA
jgi:hypothetical protein